MLSIKGKTIAHETMVKPTQNAFLLAGVSYDKHPQMSRPKTVNTTSRKQK